MSDMEAQPHERCRICEAALPAPGLDLGAMPLANAFLEGPERFEAEARYPLAVCRCAECGLLQLDHVVPAPLLYRDYLYVSGTSEAAHRHAEALARRFGPPSGAMEAGDRVVEIASNDGTVLSAFARSGARVLGVEPARAIATEAEARGIRTVPEFFDAELGARLANEEGPASLILARHVFAHVDDLRGFLTGARALLAEEGALLIEVPYLGRLYERLAFDTIYHEHLSYFALAPVARLAASLGLRVTEVSLIEVHGGSLLLRVERDRGQPAGASVKEMLAAEEREGITSEEAFEAFVARTLAWRRAFEALLGELAEGGARIVGYGAAAKANTMLCWCEEAASSLLSILDRSPLKQGRYTPGTHLLVEPPEAWERHGATHMILFAWNLEAEIRRQMAAFEEAGGRFLIPIPEPRVR